MIGEPQTEACLEIFMHTFFIMDKSCIRGTGEEEYIVGERRACVKPKRKKQAFRLQHVELKLPRRERQK